MIKVDINNQRTITVSQIYNGAITVTTKDNEGIQEDQYIIDECDFVSLLDYYIYQKEHNEEIF